MGTLSEGRPIGRPSYVSGQPPPGWRVNTQMAHKPEHVVCTQCGCRFAAPAIIESGVCPRCGGDLEPLEEARDADESGGDHERG
jgi:hypothetical protein